MNFLKIITATAAITLFGCTIQPLSPPARPDQTFKEAARGSAIIVPTNTEFPFTTGEVACLTSVFRKVGELQVTAYGAFTNESALGGPLQPSFTSVAKGFLTTLGLRPADIRFIVQARLVADAVVQGAVESHAKVTFVHESNRDFSFITRALGIDVSRGIVLREGVVSARALVDVPHAINGGAPAVYAGAATGTATIRYWSRQTDRQDGGSVAVTIIGGGKERRAQIVDAQIMASYAIRLAIARALIDLLYARGAVDMANRALTCLPSI